MTPNADLLDMPCVVCERPLGDHTMREWRTCDPATSDLPFEALPDDARMVNAAIGAQLGFEHGTIVADHVVAKAANIDVHGIRVPLIIHEFASGSPVGPPVPLVTVAYIAAPGTDGLGKYAALIGEAAHHASRSAT